MAAPASTPRSAGDRFEATLLLDEGVSRVRLVSPARARALAGLGISTVRDLVSHYPRRYIDMSSVEAVATARIGEQCTVRGRVHALQLKRPRPRLSLVEVTVVDGTGTLMVTAFRQPWLMDTLKPGMSVAVAGTLEFNYGFKRMTNPFIEVMDESAEGGPAAGGMIVPVHPAMEKVSTAWMRRLVGNALDLVRSAFDPLPLDIRLRRGLMSRDAALSCIHFPRSMDEQAAARRRLAYEELLFLEIMLMREGGERSEGRPPTAHNVDGPRMRALTEAVPFSLTAGQAEARDGILAQLGAERTANHMLLGDVGTGKTVVAAFALAAASDSGSQAAFMAPTEILARQHAQGLGPLLDAAGITWEVLTASTPAATRAAVLARVAAGTVDVLFGTHVLLEPDVVFSNLTLAVIDEQQRFGVGQRSALLDKGTCPDALYLTATPIPRTLALALFGNLTLSYLRERPRTLARTTTVHTKQARGVAYDAALAALQRGEQVYVVCPLVGSAPGGTTRAKADGSASDSVKPTSARGKASGTTASLSASQEEPEYEYASIAIEAEDDLHELDVAAAEREVRFLQAKTFVDFHVELLHGRMSGAQKQEVMQRFRDGETQVLVATTVIEVGVDVPQATVMIVEDADRFGLAQLHQLRGRVGRGELPGEVHLISSSRSETALARLAAMERTDDGFELAAFDLSLRREGDILGNRQHGASGLKLVNIVRDGDLIEAAHADARALLEADPALEAEGNRALAREARIAFGRAEAVQGG